MKPLIPLSLAALAALAAGCAFTPPVETFNASDATADTSCRQLVTEGRRDSVTGKKDPVLCGTPAQWAEFDRRAALINAGVVCRYAGTPQERCLTAAQWRAADRRVERLSYREGPWAAYEGTSSAGVLMPSPQEAYGAPMPTATTLCCGP